MTVREARKLILVAYLWAIALPANAYDSHFGSDFFNEPTMTKKMQRAHIPFPLATGPTDIELDVTRPGFSLDTVYANKRGKIVFFGMNNLSQTNAAFEFYEIGKTEPIASVPIHDPGRMVRTIKALELLKVPTFNSVKLNSGATLSAVDQIGCDYPYRVSLEVTSPRGFTTSYVVAKKWPKPGYIKAVCHDENYQKVSYHYRNEFPLLYYLSPGSVYVGFFEDPVLIRFDGMGALHLTGAKYGVVFAPGEPIRKMWSQAAGTNAALKPLVDASEQIIQAAALAQKVAQ